MLIFIDRLVNKGYIYKKESNRGIPMIVVIKTIRRRKPGTKIATPAAILDALLSN